MNPLDKIPSSFKSGEWWGTFLYVVGAIVTILVSTGRIRPDQAQPLTDSLTSMGTNIAALVSGAAVVWKLTHSRTELKVAALTTASQEKMVGK